MHRQEKITWKLAATPTVCGKSMDLYYNSPGCPSQKVDHNADQHGRCKFGCGKGGSAETLASIKYMLV